MKQRTKPQDTQETQQDFLKSAMAQLGMDRAQFADRIATPIRTLNKWLSREDSIDFRNMPPMAWQFITEIVAREGKKKPKQKNTA